MRKAQTNWNGAAVGKLGVAFGPFLFYGLGGVSFTDVTAFAQDTANTDFFGFNDGTNGRIGFIGSRADHFSAEDEAVLVGWTAGGGAELAVTKICSMGFEYRHIDAGNHNFHFASNQGPVFPGNTTISTDSDQITFRVNFYLGHLGH
jgi:opacity protein-like surface antigen